MAVERREGETGHTIVCVHGALDRGASFSRVRRRLRDHTVITYDRRGYAGSVHLGGATGVERHVADLADIVGETPSVIVGHSYGGLVALAFAAEFPSLAPSVMVYEPPLSWMPWWSGSSSEPQDPSATPAHAAEAFFRRMVGDSAWERLDDGGRELRHREGAALLGDLGSARDGRAFDALDVVTPVLVSRGENTFERHIRGAEELAEWLGEATPSVIPGAAHGAHFSHPDSFAALVEVAVTRG